MTNIIELDIATQNGVPIAIDEILDFWKLCKSVDKSLEENPKAFDEYRGHCTVKGISVKDFLKSHGVKIWSWNKVSNSYFERT